MKIHTNDYKIKISQLGRVINNKIIYNNITLSNEDLQNVSCYTNSQILKSLMKELHFESSTQVPINTVINYQFGLTIDEDREPEYINFGNYIVTENSFNVDTNSYEHVCYDKMLYSMKEYQQLQHGNFPMTVKNFISNICQDLGLSLNESDFANSERIINSDLYKDLGYTYRDILDELSAVTGSIICINLNDELEIRYANETNDEINENFFQDSNVKIGEKYGPVNSIVLSRSAESDNVDIQNEQSIDENGLCEIKIIDNQIMNFNDRSDYLPELFEKLNGLEYYINDFNSTGIGYYEAFDKYNVTLDNATYPCILFNSEFVNDQGVTEKIYNEKPEETKTDYTKSDKTDRRINQTYLIVDKQNQTINGVVSQITDNNNKVSQLTIDVNELRGEISDVADITVTEEGIGLLEFKNINVSEPININIHPTNTDISYLYPYNGLYPSNTLYPKSRYMLFERTDIETGETYYVGDEYDSEKIYKYIYWLLPVDLRFYNNVYDELKLDYENQTIQYTKRIGINSTTGEKYILPSEQTITDFEYPNIPLETGDYNISIPGYSDAYMKVRLMSQNMYTSQFATKVEVKGSLELKIDKNDNNRIVSMLNASADEITLEGGSKIKLTTAGSLIISAGNFKLDNSGNITATGGTIGGYTLTSENFQGNLNGIYDYNIYDFLALKSYLQESVNLPSKIKDCFDANDDGIVDLGDLSRINNILSGRRENDKTVTGKIEFNSKNPKYAISIKNNSNQITSSMGVSGMNTELLVAKDIIVSESESLSTSGGERINLNGSNGNGYFSGSVSQGSLEELKKDFELYTGALEEIEKTDIYKYHLKKEKETDKKHLGFVIGENYNYSHEITATTESGREVGVDLYSMTSLCLQAIKEQQKEIELLKEEIKLLKKESE